MSDIAKELRQVAYQKREASSEAVGSVRSIRMEEAIMLERAADELDRMRRERDSFISYLNGISRTTAEMVRAHADS